MNRLIDKLFHAIDCFTGILTGLMVLFVFLNVVLRTFFNSGLTWSEELARYLFVYVTYIGAISAMHSNAHLGVDTLLSRVSPKVQLALYLVSRLLIAAIMCILVHGAFKMVLQNTQSRTAALGIPYSVLYFGGIITLSLIHIFLPMFWILISGFKTNNEIFTNTFALPKDCLLYTSQAADIISGIP